MCTFFFSAAYEFTYWTSSLLVYPILSCSRKNELAAERADCVPASGEWQTSGSHHVPRFFFLLFLICSFISVPACVCGCSFFFFCFCFLMRECAKLARIVRFFLFTITEFSGKCTFSLFSFPWVQAGSSFQVAVSLLLPFFFFSSCYFHIC